jgi:DNA repair exonuclease SbcCD ATPase subunit
MTVRQHLPWSGRILLAAALLLLMCGISWLAYELGRGVHPFSQGLSREEASQLERRIATLSTERDRAASVLSTTESQLTIERSARKQLESQLKTLEMENAQLQEDLSFFESLLPSGPASREVSIRRLKLETSAPNQLRYRLLIMRHAKAEHDFDGNLQLSVELAGKLAQTSLLFPSKNDAQTDQFRLRFRHYQRVEGILKLPEGSQVKSVEARVYQNGKLRAQQSANM